jgi:hypothetical protein
MRQLIHIRAAILVTLALILVGCVSIREMVVDSAMCSATRAAAVASQIARGSGGVSPECDRHEPAKETVAP